MVKLALGKYVGFNDSHLQEKLTAAEGMVLSRQSVRRMLRAAQIGSPQKRRAPKYRSRRDRREQEGMMVQTDASRHDWLEGRRPMPTILGWIEAHLQAVFAPRARVAADPDIEALFVWCRIEQVDTVVFDVSHGNDFETLKRECLGYIRRELY